MARGWESKAVEAQQDAAAEGRSGGPYLYPDDAPQRAARETLMLARSRTASDLERASAPAHRSMLQQAIAELDVRIATLNREIQ